MALRSVTVELPEHIVSLLGEDQPATDEAREAIILSLLRKAKISQGTAARLLGITRYELLDLMAELRIPSAPRTIEDAQAELDAISKFSRQ